MSVILPPNQTGIPPQPNQPTRGATERYGPTTPTPVGSGSTPALAKTTSPLQLALSPGQQLDVRLRSVLNANELLVQLRPQSGAGSSGEWSAPMRVRVTGDLSQLLMQHLNTLPRDQPLMERLRHTGDLFIRSLSGQPAVPNKDNALLQGSPRQLSAEVVALKPSVLLKIIPERTGAQAPQWVNQQLRLHLPEARPLTTTLEQWRHTLVQADTKASPTPLLPQSVHQSLDQLLAQLPTAQQLTNPAQLQQALNQSGIWLEAMLGQVAAGQSSRRTLSHDLKSQLLRLAAQLRQLNRAPNQQRTTKSQPRQRTQTPSTASASPRTARAASQPLAPQPSSTQPTPGQLSRYQSIQHQSLLTQNVTQRLTQMLGQTSNLARDVDGMLKQVVSHQLQTLDSGADTNRWALEMPFHSSEGLHALEADIQRDQVGEDEDEERWSLELRLDLPNLGPVLITLSLQGNRVNTSFLAQQHDSVALLNENLYRLRAQLESRALEVANLHAKQGWRKKRPPASAPLLDETA